MLLIQNAHIKNDGRSGHSKWMPADRRRKIAAVAPEIGTRPWAQRSMRRGGCSRRAAEHTAIIGLGQSIHALGRHGL